MFRSPVILSIVFPLSRMFPNLPLLGVMMLLFTPSVIVRLDSDVRSLTVFENDTSPVSWLTKNASPTLKSPRSSMLTKAIFALFSLMTSADLLAVL